MRFLFCLAPGTILLAAGAYLLTSGHETAGGCCIFFGILSLGNVSYSNDNPRQGGIV